MPSSLTGFVLEDSTTDCPYIQDNEFSSEQVIIKDLKGQHLDVMLEKGYRHFGEYFFRPTCGDCCQCIPIRVPLKDFKFTRSHKKLFSRNSSLRTVLERSRPDEDKYRIYLDHKRRFHQKHDDDYELFAQTFYRHFSFSFELLTYDRDQLVAVSHIDITKRSISAVYCYYLEEYSKMSPGKFSILKEIEYGLQNGQDYLYLGYYIPGNRHMNYKSDYYPNQLLNGDKWTDYIDTKGEKLLTEPAFKAGERLFAAEHEYKDG